MLDVSTITVALETLLRASAELSAATIERSTRINFDPARAMNGWIGVYPGTVETAPRAMGGKQWKDDTTLQVVVQTASYTDDGAAASDLLEELIGKIYDVINTDLTLGVSGVRVIGFGREYRYVVFDDNGLGDLFMPQAVIKLKLEVRSS